MALKEKNDEISNKVENQEANPAAFKEQMLGKMQSLKSIVQEKQKLMGDLENENTETAANIQS